MQITLFIMDDGEHLRLLFSPILSLFVCHQNTTVATEQ